MTNAELSAAFRSRLPLNPGDIEALLSLRFGSGGGAPSWQIRTVQQTGSTNVDLAVLAGTGADRVVLIAEEQLAGKGRLGRTWTAPAGAGLIMSVLLRLPEVPIGSRSWIGAIMGIALVRAAVEVTGLQSTLKWPNDLLINDRKGAGILAESTPDGVIVGMGLNVSLTVTELPRPDATSLALAGALQLDRTQLAARILDQLSALVIRWQNAGGDCDISGIRDSYRNHCSTLGQQVRLELPDGTVVNGRALDVGRDGSILIEQAAGILKSYSAADVQHLRPDG